MEESKQGAFRETIRRLWDAYASAWLARDMDAWISLWDTAGVQMPPDTAMRSGRDVIHEAVKKDIAGVRYDTFRIDLDEAVADTELGIARGNYVYSFHRTAESGSQERSGKYLTIFRRQADGSWKIYRDCFNLNAPAH